MKNQLKHLLGLFLLCLVASNLQAQGTSCANAQLFCDNIIDPFPAGVNQPAAPAGNDYDCLFTQPNPAWYYLNISQAGNLDFTLQNTNNQDIDFIVWGPFPNLGAAVNSCGNLQNVADCSYSANATEQVTINNVQVGEVYILLITNFSNQPTDIFAVPGSGTASTDCDCGLNTTYSTPALAQNSGELRDTVGSYAEFAVCPNDTLLFQIDLGAAAGDSLSIFNSTLFNVFPIPTAGLFGPFYVNNFDSVQYLVQIDASGLSPGNYDFEFELLASGTNNCVEVLPIRVVVPGASVSTSDAIVCPITGGPVQLEATPYGAGGGTYSWQQVSGPNIPLSNASIANPTINVPAGLPEGTVLNYAATYTDPLGCSGSDTVAVTLTNTVVLNTPIADASLCEGDTLSVLIDGISTLPGTGSCGLNTASPCLSPSTILQIGQDSINPLNTPYNGLWEDSRTQLLFRASELQAQGVVAGLLTSLAFYIEPILASATVDYNGFTIKIGCVADSVLTDTLVSGLTTVYSNSITGTEGWNTYPFQSNYEWDGSSNLLVEICFDNSTWDGGLNVRGTATPFISTAQVEADGEVGCTLPGTNAFTNNERPNLRFGNCLIPSPLSVMLSPAGLSSNNPFLVNPDTTTTYIANITDGFCSVNDTFTVNVEEALLAPQVLCGTATTSSVRFDWNTITGATAYEYSTDGGQTWTLTTATGVDITGLALGEAVTVIVRAIDANNPNCPTGLSSIALTCTAEDCSLEATADILNNPCDAIGAGEVRIGSTGALNALSYDWGAGAQTDSLFTNLNSGSYTVTVTEAVTGCTDTVQFYINEGIVLDAWIESLGQSAAEVSSLPATLDIGAEIQSDGTVRYRWTSSLLADSLAQNTTVLIEESANYAFEIIVQTDDCEQRDTVFVDALQTGFTGMPNIFSPNGDEVNDRFAPVELIGANVERFQIFNRWGQTVYDNPNYDDGGWDGRHNGEPQPRDVYIYVLEYRFLDEAELRTLRGEVTLLR